MKAGIVDASAGTPRAAPRLARVVVALDFSEPSAQAAAWVSQHFAPDAELVLVHVVHVPARPRFLEGRDPPVERLIDVARAGAELLLRELAATLVATSIRTEVRVGRPEEEVVRVAEERGADLIVVGRPRQRRGLWGRLGTTAQRVLRRATMPVLLAAEMPPAPPSRLLVGVDDSPLTGPVLDWARLLSARFAAEAVVAHVVHPLQFDHGIVMTRRLSETADDADAAVLRDAERWLAERLEQQGASELDDVSMRGRMSALAVAGLATDALIEEATRRGAELVVVGSGGGSAARRLFLGSVAEGMLRDSPCPVFVVKRDLPAS